MQVFTYLVKKSMVFYYNFRERNLSEIGNMTRTLFMAIGNNNNRKKMASVFSCASASLQCCETLKFQSIADNSGINGKILSS